MIDLLSIIYTRFFLSRNIDKEIGNRRFREKEKYCKIGTNSEMYSEKIGVFNNISLKRGAKTGIARECHGNHQSETKSRLW